MYLLKIKYNIKYRIVHDKIQHNNIHFNLLNFILYFYIFLKKLNLESFQNILKALIIIFHQY